MKVNNSLIYELAELAKLKFDKQSIKKMKTDLNNILVFINTLSKQNTEGVAPLVYLSEEINVLREDEIIDGVEQKDALKNAPEKDSDYFKVPTVLKKKL